MTSSEQKTRRHRSKTLASKPWFYLIYLAFYFVPWLFKSPSQTDVIAIIVATIVFLPVYFHDSWNLGAKHLPHITGISLIGFAISPFFGNHGVFHIYACARAGSVRPERSAWITTAVLTIAFLTFSLLTQQTWWDIIFTPFIGFLVAAGTITTSEQIEEQEILRRSNEYDQQMAALAERERIAQDLHDLLGQTLTMVTLKSEVALKLLHRDIDRAEQEITEIRDASRDALKNVRAAVSDMNHTNVDAELQRAQKILAAANVQFDVSGSTPKLDPKASHVLGLAIREAVTNIVRHAQATEAGLKFDIVNQQIIVTVQDNGVAKSITEGSGLQGVRQRLKALGGSAEITGNSGMRLSLTLPYQAYS